MLRVWGKGFSRDRTRRYELWIGCQGTGWEIAACDVTCSLQGAVMDRIDNVYLDLIRESKVWHVDDVLIAVRQHGDESTMCIWRWS